MTFKSIEEARSGLAISEVTLQEEILNHPVYQEQVAACYADACKVRDTAKLALDTVKAHQSHLLRHSREKITETALVQEVLLVPEVVDKQTDYLDALHHSLEWEGLLAAAKTRGYFLRDLAQLAIAGGYSSTTATEYQQKREDLHRQQGRRPYQSPAAKALGRPSNEDNAP